MAGNNLHVSDGVGVINTPTITGIRAVGNNIIQCDSLTHFPTGKFYATTYGTKTDAAGNTVVDESTIQDFTGTALNNQITIVSFAPGYTDKGNKVGDYVVIKPTAASANDIADRLDTTVYDHALASVNNENISLLSPGVVSGLAITVPASGTTVSIGGSLTVVDEAIVADTNGEKSRIVSATKAATQLNIAIPSMTSGQSVNIAIIAHKAASANNGTWAYVAVPGTPATAGSQQPPTKSQIESVVPSGASGQFYAIIATAIVPQGSSSITQGMLSINKAKLPSQHVDFTAGRKVRSCSSALPGSAIVQNAYQYDHIDFTFFVPNYASAWASLKAANRTGEGYIRIAGLNNNNPINFEQRITGTDFAVARFSADGNCAAGYIKFSVHYIDGSSNSRRYGAVWQSYVGGSATSFFGNSEFTVASDNLDIEPWTGNAWSGTIDPISV